MVEVWCIVQDGIPIGFFNSMLDAQEALEKYVDKGTVMERKVM